SCVRKLFILRNSHASQGKNVQRLERIWFVLDDGKVSEQVLDAYVGTHMLRADPEKLAAFLAPDATAEQREAALKAPMWIIDPLGNLMMRFPDNADPESVRGDIRKLIYNSRIGRRLGSHRAPLPQDGLSDLVPDTGSDHVRRIRAPDGFRAGLSRLARVLRQRHPAGRQHAHRAGPAVHAVWGGEFFQGLDRDDPSLCRFHSGHADHCHCLYGVALPARVGQYAQAGCRYTGGGLRAGRLRGVDCDTSTDAAGSHLAPAWGDAA